MKHGRVRKLNINKLLKNKQNNNYRKQAKIHREQMTKYDICNLAQKVKDVDLCKLKISYHVINKNDSNFTYRLFKQVLSQDIETIENSIIEYNEIPVDAGGYGKVIDKRVLIRYGHDFDGMNLCVVLSLNRSLIVTAYWVEADYHHEYLNWNRYNEIMYISL